MRTTVGLGILGYGVSASGNVGRAQDPSLRPIRGPIFEVSEKQSSPQGKVTLVARDSSLLYIVKEIARQSQAQIVFNQSLPEFRKRVTVNIQSASAYEALRSALDGTRLVAALMPDGRALVVTARDTTKGETQAATQTGVVNGRVVDSATQQGIRGATVILGETKQTTNANGEFSFRGVPAGDHQVLIRIFGYRQVTRSVQVTTGGTVTVRVGLVPVATSLSGVVTTATGQEQRLKVPNDIVKLNVDSVLQTAPVTTVSELLTNRVPGVVVQKTSGAPGAPSVIRIRGTSSLSLSNDPIVIVDGVRMNASVSNPGDENRAVRGSSGAAFNVEGDQVDVMLRNSAPSPLDQINPNSIETIEVLRGPSASALYGTDAANGIIVITTKRGRPGQTSWALNMDQGIATMPGSYPPLYTLWGRDGEGFVRICPYVLGCMAYDSIVASRALTNDRTTLFGRGSTQRYGAEIRGGSQTVRYALRGNRSHEIGYLKMPDVEADRIARITGQPFPASQRQPMRSENLNGTARLDLALDPRTDVGVSATVSRGGTQQTPLASAISSYLQTPEKWDTLAGNVKLPNFRQKTKSSIVQSIFALNGLWRPVSRIQAAADLGWNRENRFNMDLIRRNECLGTVGCDAVNRGQYGMTDGTRDVVSLNARMTFNVLSLGGITGPSTIGMNYTGTSSRETRGLANGLLLGASSIAGAEEILVTDQSREDRVAGIYLDQGVSLFGLYTTNVGVRFDRGSGIGRNVNLPKFPKLGFSIPILTPGERSWYGVSLFRLRTSYGQSAVQPSVAGQLRTYVGSPTALPGSVPGLTLNAIGNTRLRSERSVEFESGFDLDLWQDRVSVTFNRYQKNTRDLNIDRLLPPSANGVSQRINLGDVRNVGIETNVTLRIVDRDAFSWELVSNYASNRNRLTAINDEFNMRLFALSDVQRIGSARNVVGYPLNGWWMRPLVSYADVDGNKRITFDELQLADSAVYIGTGQPKYTMNIAPTFGFFRRQLTLRAALNYQHGMVRVDRVGAFTGNGDEIGRLPQRIFNDTTSASLEAQAHALAGTDYARPINVLRFDEFSLSYNVPRSLTRYLRAGSMLVALQGSNLRLWTAYSGKDPNVRQQTTDAPVDLGQLPSPRTWQLRVNLSR